MQKPTISEILHRAADEFLVSTQEEFDRPDYKQKFSCCAVSATLVAMYEEGRITYNQRVKIGQQIRQGLRNMGVDVFSTFEFGNNLPGKIRKKQQGARYAWLKFAAMIAEEQGV